LSRFRKGVGNIEVRRGRFIQQRRHLPRAVRSCANAPDTLKRRALVWLKDAERIQERGIFADDAEPSLL
jgi:hypothetical protein